MATISSQSDRMVSSSSSLEASELLQKLSLDSPKKSLVPESIKKTPSVYAPVNGVGNGVNKPVERSTSPFVDPNVFYNPTGTFQQDFMDPSVFYNPSGYPSPTYYYGGNDWERYVNSDGAEMQPGVYGDYQHSYGYIPYGTYSPSGSTMGHDGQLYGAQQYQYPMSYYQPSTTTTSTTTSRTYTPNQTTSSQGEVTNLIGNQLHLPMDATKVNQTNMENVMTNRTNVTKYSSPAHQNSSVKSNGLYGSGGVAPAYSGFSSAVQQGNTGLSGRNQNQRPLPHLTGLQHPRGTTGLGQGAYMNQMYPNNRSYGQYASTYRSGPGFMSGSHYPRINGRGWLTVDNKYKSRNRGNGAYNKETIDGLNELNRGPRAKGLKDPKDSNPITLAVKGQSLPLRENTNEDNLPIFPDREQYNGDELSKTYEDAKFFVIKSYSEDDVHKSIKYGVWTSTPNGNKKLDAAYMEAQEKKSGGCPIFLLFSVNASGQFVGLAEMVGPVDFDKTVDYWQQDKWSGCFPLKWHMVKDLPNSMLRHITLENNENKPVTNSRDTQEVRLEQGIQILEIFKSHSSKTCILDDFEFYEGRQKVMQEKKTRQQQLNKQVGNLKLHGAVSTENGGKESLGAQISNRSADIAADLSGNQKTIKDSSSNGVQPKAKEMIIV